MPQKLKIVQEGKTLFHGKSCNEMSVGTTKGPIQSEKTKTRGKYIVTAGKSA